MIKEILDLKNHQSLRDFCFFICFCSEFSCEILVSIELCLKLVVPSIVGKFHHCQAATSFTSNGQECCKLLWLWVWRRETT